MIRQICWKVKMPEGGKKEIRVDFFAGKIRWQVKFPDADNWIYDYQAPIEDWDELLDQVKRRYDRGNVAHKDLLLVEQGRLACLRDCEKKP